MGNYHNFCESKIFSRKNEIFRDEKINIIWTIEKTRMKWVVHEQWTNEIKKPNAPISRYGVEEKETMGLTFKKELVLSEHSIQRDSLKYWSVLQGRLPTGAHMSHPSLKVAWSVPIQHLLYMHSVEPSSLATQCTQYSLEPK